MKTRFIEAKAHHARLIAAGMRAKDQAELAAGWDRSPLEAMQEALAAAYYARVLLVGLEPLCIVALAPLTVLGNVAQIMLFSSSAIDRHRMAFARGCRRHLPEILSHCRLATNVADVNDMPVMKWLKWMGCEFVEGDVHRGGYAFRQFVLKSQPKERLCQQA